MYAKSQQIKHCMNKLVYRQQWEGIIANQRLKEKCGATVLSGLFAHGSIYLLSD